MKQQPWLISFEYRPVEIISGRKVPGDLTKTVDIVDMPPWKLLATQKAKINAEYPSEGLHRAGDEIVAIYWAIQLPIGAMTEDEIEMFQ